MNSFIHLKQIINKAGGDNQIEGPSNHALQIRHKKTVNQKTIKTEQLIHLNKKKQDRRFHIRIHIT